MRAKRVICACCAMKIHKKAEINGEIAVNYNYIHICPSGLSFIHELIK